MKPHNYTSGRKPSPPKALCGVTQTLFDTAIARRIRMSDIARHLNVEPNTVGRWKSGQTDMGGYDQELLAGFLGMEIVVQETKS